MGASKKILWMITWSRFLLNVALYVFVGTSLDFTPCLHIKISIRATPISLWDHLIVYMVMATWQSSKTKIAHVNISQSVTRKFTLPYSGNAYLFTRWTTNIHPPLLRASLWDLIQSPVFVWPSYWWNVIHYQCWNCDCI